MTAIFTDLQRLGLTENQTIVYLALARESEARAGELIKKTGLHRNLVYTALDELIEKRLVGSTRVRGVAVYKLLSPTRLLADIAEKEHVARNVIEELSHITQRNTQEVIVYEGIDEFRRHVRRSYELAKAGGLSRYLGTSPHWHTIVGPELEKGVNRMQIAKRLRMRGIARAAFPALDTLLEETGSLTQVRINPLISNETNNIEILDDRICIQTFTEPYTVVEIVNAELARNYQSYFDFLWKNSKPLTPPANPRTRSPRRRSA